MLLKINNKYYHNYLSKSSISHGVNFVCFQICLYDSLMQNLFQLCLYFNIYFSRLIYVHSTYFYSTINAISFAIHKTPISAAVVHVLMRQHKSVCTIHKLESLWNSSSVKGKSLPIPSGREWAT